MLLNSIQYLRFLNCNVSSISCAILSRNPTTAIRKVMFSLVKNEVEVTTVSCIIMFLLSVYLAVAAACKERIGQIIRKVKREDGVGGESVQRNEKMNDYRDANRIANISICISAVTIVLNVVAYLDEIIFFLCYVLSFLGGEAK